MGGAEVKIKIEKSQHIVVLLISLTILAICIGIGIRMQQELTEPVYFRHLIQHYLPAVADSGIATSTINLMYISDSKDECHIINVSFDGHPELKVMVYNTSTNKFGSYYLNKVCLYMEWESYEAGISDEIAEINTLSVEYANHKRQTVDIGKVYIYGGNPSDNVLEAIGAMPFIDKERSQSYESKEDLQLNGLSDSTVELMKEMDIMDYANLNGIDYRNVTSEEPIPILTNSQVDFIMVLRNSWKEELFQFNTNHDYYNIEPKLIILDKDGEEHFVPIFNQPKNITFKNYREVRKYLKLRRGM